MSVFHLDISVYIMSVTIDCFQRVYYSATNGFPQFSLASNSTDTMSL